MKDIKLAAKCKAQIIKKPLRKQEDIHVALVIEIDVNSGRNL